MKKFAFLIAGLVLAGTVSAQTAKPGNNSSKAVNYNSAIYLGVDGGFANISADKSTSSRNQRNNVGAFRISGGYQFTPELALELGYFLTADWTSTNRQGGLGIDHRSSVMGNDLSVVYKITPGLYVKGGLTYAQVSGDTVVRSGNTVVGRASDSRSGVGYLFGVGYEVPVNDMLSVNVGYTRMQRLGGGAGNNVNLFTVGAKLAF